MELLSLVGGPLRERQYPRDHSRKAALPAFALPYSAPLRGRGGDPLNVHRICRCMLLVVPTGSIVQTLYRSYVGRDAALNHHVRRRRCDLLRGNPVPVVAYRLLPDAVSYRDLAGCQVPQGDDAATVEVGELRGSSAGVGPRGDMDSERNRRDWAKRFRSVVGRTNSR